MCRSIIFFVFMLFSGLLLCQTTDECNIYPWGRVGELPSNGNHYLLLKDYSNSWEKAKNSMEDFLKNDFESRAGIRISSASIVRISNNASEIGVFSSSEGKGVKVEKNEGVAAHFSTIGLCYNKKGGYKGLYAISNSPITYPPVPDYTDRWKFKTSWKSAIVPGWGQIEKGQKGRGFLFLTTFVVSVALTFVANQEYVKFAEATYDPANDYTANYNSANKWKTIRSISLGSMIGIYSINLLDSHFSRGKYKIYSNQQNNNLNNF